jgi:hypothetical protein
MTVSHRGATTPGGRFAVRIKPRWTIALVSIACIGAANRGFAQQPAAPADAAPAAASETALPNEPRRTDRFFFETSLYTHHFRYDPAHVNHQKLVLGEWNVTENWLVGGALFDNSFGQSSQYVYGGYRFRPIATAQPFYVKLSAGLVHGYSGQYRDKIPFNHSGVAPIIVPSVGYCFSRLCSEVVVFGGAGLLVTLGVTVP